MAHQNILPKEYAILGFIALALLVVMNTYSNWLPVQEPVTTTEMRTCADACHAESYKKSLCSETCILAQDHAVDGDEYCRKTEAKRFCCCEGFLQKAETTVQKTTTSVLAVESGIATTSSITTTVIKTTATVLPSIASGVVEYVMDRGGRIGYDEVKKTDEEYFMDADDAGQDYVDFYFPDLRIPEDSGISGVYVTIEHHESATYASPGKDFGEKTDDVYVFNGTGFEYVGDYGTSRTDTVYESANLDGWVKTPELANHIRVRMYFKMPKAGRIYINYASVQVKYVR